MRVLVRMPGSHIAKSYEVDDDETLLCLLSKINDGDPFKYKGDFTFFCAGIPLGLNETFENFSKELWKKDTVLELSMERKFLFGALAAQPRQDQDRRLRTPCLRSADAKMRHLDVMREWQSAERQGQIQRGSLKD